ncbi:MAG: hypothetical protein MUC44_05280 [Beijerinckiaceae bacterium]|nr:hypothetical protein [Beijerinckiaceae bacterium]
MAGQTGIDVELDRLRAELIDFVLRETGNRLASDDLLWRQFFDRLNDPDLADRVIASPPFSALADQIAARIVADLADRRERPVAPDQQAPAVKGAAANGEGPTSDDPDPENVATTGSGQQTAGLFSGLSRNAWLVIATTLLIVAAIAGAAGWWRGSAIHPTVSVVPAAPTKGQ